MFVAEMVIVINSLAIILYTTYIIYQRTRKYVFESDSFYLLLSVLSHKMLPQSTGHTPTDVFTYKTTDTQF